MGLSNTNLDLVLRHENTGLRRQITTVHDEAVLVAFGTRRSTPAQSVLYQTAIPVAPGLALATIGGLGLGAVLMNQQRPDEPFNGGEGAKCRMNALT